MVVLSHRVEQAIADRPLVISSGATISRFRRKDDRGQQGDKALIDALVFFEESLAEGGRSGSVSRAA